MGNKKQAVETKKRKKKGRPSLLDLQKRSLRLQKSQNPNPNLSPNPYVKFPTRRSTRRSPNPNLDEEVEEEEEEEDLNARRKEKKLKLVLRIPDGLDMVEVQSDSEGGGSESRKKRKIDNVETARQNSSSKATDEALQGDPVALGPTTPLPDKKLLVFILDRLQKKDTYGVFLEPVDPEELPDYHDIVKRPMDFGTVRKKLDSGAYENLEQFESDVFLISSNAMLYNANDTIYFRQARSIQELAKKHFENLRQESDDSETEPKTVRRGRPPIKNVMKRIGRHPADRTGSEFSSDATLANARDGTHNSNSTRDVMRKGSSSYEKPSLMDASRGNGQRRSERNEEYSGLLLKVFPMKNWKKSSEIDETRRNTYDQSLQSTYAEPSILTAFDGERKLLMPIGLYLEHAYARSLARFAAKLGPIGWEIAAKRIEGVVPPGTKFGPGWVGDNEALLSKSKAILDKHSERTDSKNSPIPPSTSASAGTTASCDNPVDSGAESVKFVNHEGELGKLQFCEKSTMQPWKNGFKPGHGLKMTHGHSLGMVSRDGNNDESLVADVEEKVMSVVGNSNANPRFEEGLRGQLANKKPGPVPPDLNVDFQSTGLVVSGVSGDSKPELELQL